MLYDSVKRFSTVAGLIGAPGTIKLHKVSVSRARFNEIYTSPLDISKISFSKLISISESFTEQ
jgi:hypothetical protein